MRFQFYAIARRRKGYLPEFYASIRQGAAVGWTDDRDHCWSTDREAEAEAVLDMLMQHGHFDAYIHVYSEEVRVLP